MEYGVIMAGGAGTRLWPLSRIARPKQLLNVIGSVAGGGGSAGAGSAPGGRSLLRLAYERLLGLLPPERILICTNAAYADQVRAAIPELPEENLLGEPVGRDTANAVGFAAAVIQGRDPAAVTAFLSADHVIQPIDKFQDALRTAFAVVAQHPNALVTFGIVPTFGHTGLGYVERGEPLPGNGAHKVRAFKEKPDKQTADRYVESGRYYWNSGMFVWRADTVLADLARFLPETAEGYRTIANAWPTAARSDTLNQTYPTLKKISIDYALMEPASQGKGQSFVAVVEMPIHWLDVGSFPALAETLDTDDHNNAISAGLTELVDSDDNIILSDDPSHLITTIGLSDHIIVHTKDATLICPKEESQKIKDLVARLKDKHGARYQ